MAEVIFEEKKTYMITSLLSKDDLRGGKHFWQKMTDNYSVLDLELKQLPLYKEAVFPW